MDKIMTRSHFWIYKSRKTENNYLSPDQSRFLRLHSTVTSLLKSTDGWYKGLDLGKLVGLVIIDLKKAFDTVDNDILWKKLEHYGIQGRELAWFKSYLCYRKQFYRVNGVDSSIEEIEIGVPQGSCLGPHLFLIYINDLPRAAQNSKVSMFADDTSLTYQSNNIYQLNKAIKEDLKQVEKWLNGNNSHSMSWKFTQCSFPQKLSIRLQKTRMNLLSWRFEITS